MIHFLLLMPLFRTGTWLLFFFQDYLDFSPNNGTFSNTAITSCFCRFCITLAVNHHHNHSHQYSSCLLCLHLSPKTTPIDSHTFSLPLNICSTVFLEVSIKLKMCKLPFPVCFTFHVFCLCCLLVIDCTSVIMILNGKAERTTETWSPVGRGTGSWLKSIRYAACSIEQGCADCSRLSHDKTHRLNKGEGTCQKIQGCTWQRRCTRGQCLKQTKTKQNSNMWIATSPRSTPTCCKCKTAAYKQILLQ